MPDSRLEASQLVFWPMRAAVRHPRRTARVQQQRKQQRRSDSCLCPICALATARASGSSTVAADHRQCRTHARPRPPAPHRTSTADRQRRPSPAGQSVSPWRSHQNGGRGHGCSLSVYHWQTANRKPAAHYQREPSTMTSRRMSSSGPIPHVGRVCVSASSRTGSQLHNGTKLHQHHASISQAPS